MKKLYNKFLRVSENEKITEQKFIAKMATSVLTIFLSVVMLCGTTFAYFTHTVTAGVLTIQSAHFTANVTVEPTQNLELSGNTYICKAGGTFIFTVTAGGNASKGYFVITAELSDGIIAEYITAEKTVGETVTVTFHAKAGQTITFDGCWGANDVGTFAEDTIIIGTAPQTEQVVDKATPPQIHIVSENETLESIALLYNVTVEQICEINGLAADSVLEVGQPIAIPEVEKQEETEDTEPTPEPSPSVEPTEEPDVSPESSTEPTEEPDVSPEPSTEPTEEPDVSPEPSAEPTEEPDVSPEPSTQPTEEPDVSPEPSIEPTEEPDVSPEPSAEPTVAPETTPVPVG